MPSLSREWDDQAREKKRANAPMCEVRFAPDIVAVVERCCRTTEYPVIDQRLSADIGMPGRREIAEFATVLATRRTGFAQAQAASLMRSSVGLHDQRVCPVERASAVPARAVS